VAAQPAGGAERLLEPFAANGYVDLAVDDERAVGFGEPGTDLVEISGFADATGSRELNQRLSQRRVESA